MQKRTKLAVGAGAALAVVGASGAVAADRLTPKEESKVVVADAAKQLGVRAAGKVRCRARRIFRRDSRLPLGAL